MKCADSEYLQGFDENGSKICMDLSPLLSNILSCPTDSFLQSVETVQVNGVNTLRGVCRAENELFKGCTAIDRDSIESDGRLPRSGSGTLIIPRPYSQQQSAGIYLAKCRLSQTSHGVTINGKCLTRGGYYYTFGSCNYSCENGEWTQNSNNCGFSGNNSGIHEDSTITILPTCPPLRIDARHSDASSGGKGQCRLSEADSFSEPKQGRCIRVNHLDTVPTDDTCEYQCGHGVWIKKHNKCRLY